MDDHAPDSAARRAVLAGLAALPFAGSAAAATLAFPDDCTLLAAGPEDGATARRGRLIAASMAVRLDTAGGADGVTAANQFAARAPQDGSVALLVPGIAALAWLCGEARAQFDAGAWLPVLAGVSPGLLACRLPAAALRPGQPLRIAAGGPAGPELPALLAADLLGLAVEPVFGLGEREAAARALAAGAVDAVLVAGPDGLAYASALAAAGAPAAFSLGLPDARGIWRRDLAMPELQAASELLDARSPPPPLVAAFHALAAAAQLDYAMVLPPLTQAAMVGGWRRAAELAAASATLRQAEPDLRPLAGGEAQAVIGALKLGAPALASLRGWLAIAGR